jgi:hypothetical protein
MQSFLHLRPSQAQSVVVVVVAVAVAVAVVVVVVVLFLGKLLTAILLVSLGSLTVCKQGTSIRWICTS